MSLPIAATPTLNAEESERFLAMVEEGLKHPCGPVPTPRIEKALDKLDKNLRKPKPFYGGLITDQMPERVRKLEERVKKLEFLQSTNPSGCCCKFADDEETILELCFAHKIYFDARLKAMLPERDYSENEPLRDGNNHGP